MVYGLLTATLQGGQAGGASVRELSVMLHPLSPTEAAPLGDMPLAPFAMTKRTEADLAQAMVEHLDEPVSTLGAETLLNTPASAFASLMRR